MDSHSITTEESEVRTSGSFTPSLALPTQKVPKPGLRGPTSVPRKTQISPHPCFRACSGHHYVPFHPLQFHHYECLRPQTITATKHLPTTAVYPPFSLYHLRKSVRLLSSMSSPFFYAVSRLATPSHALSMAPILLTTSSRLATPDIFSPQ